MLRSLADDGNEFGDEVRAEVGALIERVRAVWLAFADLHRLAHASRLLSDDEVEQLCSASGRVSTELRRAYPKVRVQLKIHIVEAHLVSFARRWRTAGFFVEDACESIHALVNRLNRRFACLHGDLKIESKARALEILARKDLQAMRDARRARVSGGPYHKRQT